MYEERALWTLTRPTRRSSPWGSVPYVAMHWDDGGRNLGPDDVLAVADGIEAWAPRLRELAEQLRGIRAAAGNLPDQGDGTMIA